MADRLRGHCPSTLKAAVRRAYGRDMSSDHSLLVEVPALGDFVELLGSHGYVVVGPTLRDGVVVLDEITTYDSALVDLGVATSPGSYRTIDHPGSRFGGIVGPDASLAADEENGTCREQTERLDRYRLHWSFPADGWGGQNSAPSRRCRVTPTSPCGCAPWA